MIESSNSFKKTPIILLIILIYYHPLYFKFYIKTITFSI